MNIVLRGRGLCFLRGAKWEAICGRAANKNSLKFCIFIKLESDPRCRLGALLFLKRLPFRIFLFMLRNVASLSSLAEKYEHAAEKLKPSVKY